MATKVLAATVGIVNGETGAAFYRTTYRLSEPAPNGHVDGEVLVAFDGLTETEANAAIQLAVAIKATAETNGTLSFTVDDVRGGRI